MFVAYTRCQFALFLLASVLGACSTETGGSDAGVDVPTDTAVQDTRPPEDTRPPPDTNRPPQDTGNPFCVADPGEYNDERLAAHPIRMMFTDEPPTNAVLKAFNIHSASDVDWFRFPVEDKCCGGNPTVRVTLDDIVDGDDYDLALIFVCARDKNFDGSCSEGRADATGTACLSDKPGNQPERVAMEIKCSGVGADDGMAFVGVSPARWAGQCHDYSIVVEVD